MQEAKKVLDTWARYLRSLMDSNLVFVGDDGSLAKWRKTLLTRLLSVLAVVGWLVGVPSALLSISEGLWVLSAAALVCPLVLTIFYLIRERDHVWLSIRLLLLLYLLSLVTLSSHGLVALIFLVSLPVMAVLLVSERLAAWVVVINTLTLSTMGYVMKVEGGVIAVSDSPMLHWLVVGLNFAFSTAVLIWACAFVLRGVDAVLVRQRDSVRELKENAHK